MSAAAALRLRSDGPVATLTLAREAKRNALDRAMWEALPGLLTQVATDRSVRVLIVRGAGREAFSAGADLAELAGLVGREEAGAAYLASVEAAVRALADLPLPTIALIHGHCVGGGVELAAACDLRIASADARVAVTPARVGLVYGLSASRRLMNVVGPSHAAWLLFSGETLDAERAREIGFLNEVVAPDRLDDHVHARAVGIAARSPASLRAAKRILAKLKAGVREDDEESVRVQAEYMRLAETLYAGVEPSAPAPLEDREIFELLGFD